MHVRACVALLVLAVSISTAGGEANPPADYFPAKEGMRWGYKAKLGDRSRPLAFKITKVEKTDGGIRVYRQHSEDTEQKKWADSEVFVIDGNGVSQFRTKDGKPVGKPLVILKYPLKQGETWSGTATDGDREKEYTCSVGKPERVKVKAGAYDAIPIRLEGKSEKDKKPPLIVTWYAPGVGIVRQTVRVEDQELVMELQSADRPK
jgi:hypothetical protein